VLIASYSGFRTYLYRLSFPNKMKSKRSNPSLQYFVYYSDLYSSKDRYNILHSVTFNTLKLSFQFDRSICPFIMNYSKRLKTAIKYYIYYLVQYGESIEKTITSPQLNIIVLAIDVYQYLIIFLLNPLNG